jgi:hypothetical protein
MICKTCKQDKPPEDFSVSRAAKDGRVHYCKACLKVARAARSAAKPSGWHEGLTRGQVKELRKENNWCTTCKQWKAKDLFRANSFTECRECNNARRKEIAARVESKVYASHTRGEVAEIKAATGTQRKQCAVCKTWFHPALRPGVRAKHQYVRAGQSKYCSEKCARSAENQRHYQRKKNDNDNNNAQP